MPSKIILHVAEKNSVAKGVAAILAQPGRPRTVSGGTLFYFNGHTTSDSYGYLYLLCTLV